MEERHAEENSKSVLQQKSGFTIAATNFRRKSHKQNEDILLG